MAAFLLFLMQVVIETMGQELTQARMKQYFIKKPKTGRAIPVHLSLKEKLPMIMDLKTKTSKVFKGLIYTKRKLVRNYFPMLDKWLIEFENAEFFKVENKKVVIKVPVLNKVEEPLETFAAAVVVLKDTGQEWIPCQEKDYRTLIRWYSFGELKPVDGICHLCGSQTKVIPPISDDRKSIIKLFTRTNCQYSYNLESNFAASCAVCDSCLEEIQKGDEIVRDNMMHLAPGSQVAVIPEDIQVIDAEIEPYTYTDIMGKIKWVFGLLEDDLTLRISDLFALNFIFYGTSGNAVWSLGVIEDVPILRLTQIKRYFDQVKDKWQHSKLKLSDIGYRIPSDIVDTSNKKKKSTVLKKKKNPKDVFLLYDSLLKGYKIPPEKIIVPYLERIIACLKDKDSDKDQRKQYDLKAIRNKITKQVHECLVFLAFYQKMECLKYPIFKKVVDMQNTGQEQSLEQFLDEKGLTTEEKSLFYLGRMLSRAIKKQSDKQTTLLSSLPLAGGVPPQSIPRLFLSITEKLRQYDMLKDSKVLYDMHKFTEHDKLASKEGKFLTPYESALFLMMGYSSLWYLFKNKTSEVSNKTKGSDDNDKHESGT